MSETFENREHGDQTTETRKKIKGVIDNLDSRQRVHALTEGAGFLLSVGMERDYRLAIDGASDVIIEDITKNDKESKSWRDHAIRIEIKKLGSKLAELGRWHDLQVFISQIEKKYKDDFSDDNRKFGYNSAPLREMASDITEKVLETNDVEIIQWLKTEILPRLYQYHGSEFKPAPYMVRRYELINCDENEFKNQSTGLIDREQSDLKLMRGLRIGNAKMVAKIIEEAGGTISDLDKTNTYIQLAEIAPADAKEYLDAAVKLVVERLPGSYVK
jgi:hypothetical protein